MANKTNEYESLRHEMIEYWKIQENLSYASIIIVGTAFLGFDKIIDAAQKSPNIPVAWLVFSILHLLIYVISTRLWMNYHRIFRIGAYIRIFHDDKAKGGNSENNASWHHIWRDMSSKRRDYNIKYDIGSFAPKVDAITLFAILVIGFFTAYFTDPSILGNQAKLFFAIANGAFGCFTLSRMYKLTNVSQEASVYSEAFLKRFEEEQEKNAKI